MNIPITRKQFISYAVLPQIRPRLADLFASGFHYIPYFMALVYMAVRLLPANHPYGDAANMGRFGIRHVVGEAANNLVVNKNNIDQIILFICILIGMGIVFVQLCLLGMSFFFQPVMAATLFPTSFSDFFITEFPANDIAMMMMDMVFGVPEIFNSCISTAEFCEDMNGDLIGDVAPFNTVGPMSPLAYTIFPFPLHHGLHQMFQVYSIGLLVVAVMITCYFIVTILAETAQSGTPFGKRFNKVWAPIRLVVAFGLLVPVGYGLNSSQYIVLHAAKYGSGFATNGWELFNGTLSGGYLGETKRLVTTPNVPEVSTLLQFYYIARTCQEATKIQAEKGRLEIKPYLVKSATETVHALPITSGTSYADAMNFADGETVLTLVFGSYDKSMYGYYKGFVKPICGEVTMTLTDPRGPGESKEALTYMQRYYWFLLKDLWFDTQSAWFDQFPLNTALANINSKPKPEAEQPNNELKQYLRKLLTLELSNVMSGPNFINPDGVIPAMIKSDKWAMPVEQYRKGWAGAGIWYNRVAEMNGAVTTAIFNIPAVSKYPFVMEYVALKNDGQNEVPISKMYTPISADDKVIPAEKLEDLPMMRVLNAAYDYWQSDDGMSTSHTAPTGNIIVDVINLIFGTDGLYSMKKNTDVHPLAQLVGVGRSLVESSIRNLGVATLGGAAGSVVGVMSPFAGKLTAVAAKFLVAIGMIGLTIGFILYYVIPFLPFVYFFFAVGGWIKGIFEAMVGAPLWALAHLRIDGNGLSGQAAVGGYFLIFEIFLRPILIIFGLLASISIFGALITVLNQSFDLITSNLTGFEASSIATNASPTDIAYYRAPVDEFFFTVIYTIIVYLMGMSSFKLIDLIPNNILRWMGQSTATFNDSQENPAESMVGTTSVGAQQAIGSIGGKLSQSIGKE